MKKLGITAMIACLAIMGLIPSVGAEPPPSEIVTADEALTVATNWIALILHHEGNWGGSRTAQVAEVREFKRGDRVIGHFVRVEPQGFVIVSIRRELGPVKAYSVISGLDPGSEEGLSDLIKDGMERVLDGIEALVGPIESAQAEAIDNILEINYRQSWAVLDVDAETFERRLETYGLDGNYQGGEPPLLSSHWKQGAPYNLQVPAPPSGDDCTQAHCAVGCIATAGAQVMRYWHWPPYGQDSPYDDRYDWPNMPDIVTELSPTQQIDAVAELSHEVGVAVDMDYCGWVGCASAAYFASAGGPDLLDAFEDHFRYNTAADDRDRNDYSTGVAWFNEIKGQLNLNRPLPYTVEDHAIVCDGWLEEGSLPDRYYHMNYGYGKTSTCQNGCDTWYLLDALYWGGQDVEETIINLYPAPSLGDSLSGSYSPPSFPYRYFDQDATGDDVVFDAGHLLQFLPGVRVTCTGGGKIVFRGSSTDHTVLFSQGNESRGIRIYNGHIYLYQNGSMVLH